MEIVTTPLQIMGNIDHRVTGTGRRRHGAFLVDLWEKEKENKNHKLDFFFFFLSFCLRRRYFPREDVLCFQTPLGYVIHAVIKQIEIVGAVQYERMIGLTKHTQKKIIFNRKIGYLAGCVIELV